MKTMKAMQVNADHQFELVEREIPEPGSNEVRVKVEACGVCHSDVFIKEGTYPGIRYPRVPGHEVTGIIDKVGEGVDSWTAGQRVGVGWHGGHCFTCDPCRSGDFVNCINKKVTGISYDGGYQEYMIAPISALAMVPDDLSLVEAAPLLCAGVTTFTAIRNTRARAGDLVAIQGVGGLGHLAIQYASRMGMRTVAVSRGQEKKELAQKLGAHHYIDTKENNGAEELQKLGGAKVILATAPNGKAIAELVDGLGSDGELCIVAAGPDTIEVAPVQLIRGNRSINGWTVGTGKDSEDALDFSALTQSLPLIETFPLEKAAEAYEHMMSNQVRFRAVLTMN
ncbi:alcohol dehydrogenase [Marininema halotolerans]|uniref:Alcohol dehydrogenase n=1 Tax=Marininema halotolerans TaxID=1155944 RepID=A0A1I6RJN4_9BACL|nr:alcohol dehydrogenase [Marininema halotolerans]SFS64931.1 alcohol dehydrogenase, propanol-preferring [Marininema halotolerans]